MTTTATKNALTTFNFQKNPIRVVEINGEPWFVASDVCRTLDLDNPSYVLKRLDENEKASFKLPNQRGSASRIIAKSGLYKLVLRSDKPQAKPFQDWIAQVVIPSLRKHGGYIVGQETLGTEGGTTDEELLAKSHLIALRIIAEKDERIAKLAADNTQLTIENDDMREVLTIVTMDKFRQRSLKLPEIVSDVEDNPS